MRMFKCYPIIQLMMHAAARACIIVFMSAVMNYTFCCMYNNVRTYMTRIYMSYSSIRLITVVQHSYSCVIIFFIIKS